MVHPNACMTTSEAPTLPRWAYIVLAAITAAIGLAASGVTAKFFVLGLDKLESDPMARSVLMSTGVLMIVTELAAFGLAALLPSRQLRSMRATLIVCGALLLAFEATTIYVTQAAIDHASEVEESSRASRILELQATIESRRAAAKSLRANGEAQSNSSNAWTRTLGAAALRDALKVEEHIAPMSEELARLQAGSRPTMGAVLGHAGTQAYGIVRGLLISAMGLVMFSAAGALLREGLPGKMHQGNEPARNNTIRMLPTKSTRFATLRGLWSVVAAVGKGRCATDTKIPSEPQKTSLKALRRA